MKLKLSIFKNLIALNMTAKELNLFLLCLRYQDDTGRVVGVHHREMCQEGSMCEQSFYDALKGLEEKNLISYKRVNGDYDITITNNNFSDKKFKGQYINLHHGMFVSKDFWDLSANEKLLAIDLYRQCEAGTGKKVIGKKKFYEKYMEMFHVCKKTIAKYITHLRKIFRFMLNMRNYHISHLDFVKPALSAAEMYRQRIARTLIRRSRAITTPGSFNDIVQLLKQYHNNIKDIVDVLGVAMKVSTQKEKILQPALVHSLILQSIGKGNIKQKVNKHSKFDFEQHDYDFEALERDLGIF